MKIRPSAALIPLFAVVAACAAAGDDVPQPASRGEPEPASASVRNKEVFTYSAITKDGKRVPLGKTEVTYSPDRKTFDEQVKRAGKARKPLPNQTARKIVRDTYTDGRAPTTRTVHPNDHAANLDRDDER